MPHEKKYKFTKEGYIVRIEERLFKAYPHFERLSKDWWRLKIGNAAILYSLVQNQDLKKFWSAARRMKLKKPGRVL